MKNELFLNAFLVFVIAGCTTKYDTPNQTKDVQTVAYVTSQNFDEEVYNSVIPVLVDFTAVWCGPCKEVDPLVESLVAEMQGRAKIVKLDIDDTPDVYEDLRVNGVPTVVFFNNGVEEDRISGPQSRETYVKFLETMIGGASAIEATLTLLNIDSFRRHFISTKSVAEVEAILSERPGLLVDSFENGQTPLSLIINTPSVRQDELIELTLSNDPSISPHDLVGLGYCDQLQTAIDADPEVTSQPDFDGATPLYVALTRSFRLENGGCLQTLLDANADPSSVHSGRYSLNRAVILRKDVALLEEFLSRGLNPEFTDTIGQTALHIATSYGMVEHVRALLEWGVNAQARTDKGQTAVEMLGESLLSSKSKIQDADSPEMRAYYTDRVESLEQIMELLETP